MDFFLNNFWVVLALPLFASAFIAMFARQLRRNAWIVGSGLMGVALLWSLAVLAGVSGSGEAGHAAANYLTEPVRHLVWENWAPWGPYQISLGLMVDNLTAIMMVVVTVVSFAVQVYSQGYFASNEKRFTRFYAAINLFSVGMLGLVMADNLFLLLVSWEIMGLCSYLLIGHWYEQEWPRYGQIKAFLTTRVGDIGLMLGIWIIFAETRQLTWDGLATSIPQLVQDPATAATLALGAFFVFTGAIGKSAQFPLHVWLPDAMAGPTPGSAIIHAATMVAAGVYLVARSFMIFGNVPEWVLITVAFVGAFTSIFAASIATLRHDIKEVLAYSTISQLGYMIMALGVGGWAAGNFHMVTHAFFKSLLFLAAGSVIAAHHHNQLLHKMGGLRKKVPITFITWMVGYLALIGFPGFSGFFSKDELLLMAYDWQPAALAGMPWLAKLPFVMALITAFLTAYYMTRATYLAFFGEPRDKELYEHAHESPKVMTIPLILLSIPAALSGWFWAALPYHFTHAEWMKSMEHFLHLPGVEHSVTFAQELQVTGMATTAAFLGIFVGWLLYAKVQPETRAAWIEAGKPLYTLVRNKYYVDEFYDAAVIRTTQAVARFIAWFDGAVVDGLVNFVGTLGTWIAEASAWFDRNVVDALVVMWADISRAVGSAFRRLATGYIQQYMVTFAAAVVACVILFQVFS